MELALEKARNIFFAIPNTVCACVYTHTHIPDTLLQDKPVIFILGMCLEVEESLALAAAAGFD